MNKVYKIIWSKTKNCYIVVSELAKSHTKAPKSGVMSRALVAGVLASVLSFGHTTSSLAAETAIWDSGVNGNIVLYADGNVITKAECYAQYEESSSGRTTYIFGNSGGSSGGSDGNAIYNLSVNGRTITYTKGNGTVGTITTQDNDTTYSAGNGLLLGGTTFSVKAGTGITVDGHGVSITPGSVASGNANAITGGTAYSELRPSNGTFVKSNQTTATNLTALDTASKNAIKELSANANIITYTKGDGTTGTISTSAKYVGINSSGGTNQSGEGATGTDAIAIGADVEANAINGILIGKNAKNKVLTEADTLEYMVDSEGNYILDEHGQPQPMPEVLSPDNTIVIGANSSAVGGIVIGANSKNGDYDTKVGAGYGIVLGDSATNMADYGIAIGYNAKVNEDAYGGIAIGYNSVADLSGSVSFGNERLKRRLVNIADGYADSDAFTVGQYKSNTTVSDGLFVKQTKTTAQNLTALDVGAAGSLKALTIDGNMLNYIRNDNTMGSVPLPIDVQVQPGASDTPHSTMFSKTTTVGSVTAFASNASPTGYLLCDGRAVSRTKYPQLFAKIGTTYGAGDGRTTFNLPNLVNRFVEGSNISGQYIQAGLPNITGTFAMETNWNGSNFGGAFYNTLANVPQNNAVPGGDVDEVITFDASRVSSVYGKSDTVQPESLKLQYYIKTEDEMYNVRYLGINNDTGLFNEFGEGATGTNAIALGADSRATAANSVAIGKDSVTTTAQTVSFGHTHNDKDGHGNTYTSDMTRRLINVTAGQSGSDAATVAQTVQVNNGFNSKVNITGLNSIGQHMVQIDVPGEGLVQKDNTGLIKGDTLYTEVRQYSDGNYVRKSYSSADNVRALDTQAKINVNAIIQERNDRIEAVNAEAEARTLEDTALSNRIGVQEEDGSYIRSSSVNNVSQNIAVLDDQLKVTSDTLTQEIEDRQAAMRTESTNRALADNELSARIGTQSSNGYFIKKSSVNSVADNVAVLDSQLKTVTDGLQEEVENRTTALQTEKEERLAEDTLLSNRIDELAGTAVLYDNSSKAKVTLAGANGTTITNLRAGAVGPNSMDAINGSQLYRTNQLIGTLQQDGRFIQKDANVSDNLQALDDNLASITQNVRVSDESSVKYDDENKDKVTLAGSNGTLIDNLQDGLVEADSKQAITGGQLWNLQNYVNNEVSTLQETDRNLDERITRLSGRVDHAVFYDDESHDIATLDGARGTVLKNVRAGEIKEDSMDAVNGGQIFSMKEDMKGLSKDIEQNKNNIRALNTSVIAALDSVTSMGLLVDAMDDIKADASLNNISDSGKGILNSYVTNIVQDYLAGRGLPPVEDTTMNGSNIVPPTAYNTSSTLSVRDEGDGSLSVGHGSSVSGRSSIAMGVGNQVNANNSGIFGDPSVINADASYILGNDDTINTGATGSFIVGNDSLSDAKGGLLFGSNTKATVEAEDGIALGNRAEVSAKGSVALGTDSIADIENVLSIGNSNLKRKIVNVADGNISQNSSEAITGAQLFETNEKVQQNTDAIDLHTQQIAQKADVDASNIDASLWSTKLGIGTIASGDTNLVTGGTVYNAIGTAMSNTVASISASVPVKVGENDAILIGNNYGGDTVSVFNKDGEGRVITGVVTNPDDVSSAANVGYVDTVGTNIINGVNGTLSSMNSKINKVGANAAALASLNPGSLDGDEKFGVAAAVGNYRDATAGAVGLFYKPQDNVTMNVRGSFGTDENMVGAGVYVALNKGNTPSVSKAQMVKTINAQADQIDKQAKRIHQVEQENANMQHALLQMQARLEALENK